MSQNVVITGGNRGIGLALVKEYLQRGARVIAVCRQGSAALADTAARVIDGVDVARAEDMDHLHRQLADNSIDILINNAGILRSDSLEQLDFDAAISQFQVNCLGPLRVTRALLPLLGDGARVGLITSRMGSIADNSSGGSYGYRMSKAALNAAGMSLAHDLRARGIAVAILHPGYVQTDMVGGRGDVPPELAAQRLAARMDDLNLDNSGTFWHANGQVLPW